MGQKSQTKIEKKSDEIGQILFPRALNDTKKIRKAGADILANVGAEKPDKNLNKSNRSPDFHKFSVELS